MAERGKTKVVKIIKKKGAPDVVEVQAELKPMSAQEVRAAIRAQQRVASRKFVPITPRVMRLR